MLVLGLRPFLDPLPLHAWWWAFLVPLSVGIAVSYKAVRVPTLEGYWRSVATMTAQIIVGMIVLGAAAYVLLGFVVPYLAPMPR